MKKIFIDTNILTAYILLSAIKRYKKEKQKSLWKRYIKLKSAYEFILKIKEYKQNHYTFITSNLAVAEIINSILDEVVCKRMSNDGLPLSSWIRRRDHYLKQPLKNWELKELNSNISKIYKIKNLSIIPESYDFELIAKLIFKYKLKTQDSILFSTALKEKCSFYITRDEQDFIKNKELNEEFKEIKILLPEKALNLLKK